MSNNTDKITLLPMGNHGENIYCIRRMRNIKQPELAKLIGVSERTMTKLESQEVIEDKYLEKIAKELDVTVEEIKYYNAKTSSIKIFNFSDSSFNNEPNSNATIHTGIPTLTYDNLMALFIEQKNENAELRAENAVLKYRLKPVK